MSFSSNFEKAFTLLIGEEGGYVNHPRDPGGETKYGIAKRYHPHVDIKALTLDGAKAIYWEQYWMPSGAALLPWPIAFVLFDAVVNMGLHTATQLLQEALGEVPDGKRGPRTNAALYAQRNDPELVVRFQAERAIYYAENANFDAFGRGWLRRVIRGAMAAVSDEVHP